jgi:ATP-dependent DNA ligase
MTFIAPMLCSVLRDPVLLEHARYIAEPKLDGQRAQVHVAGGHGRGAIHRSASAR